MELIDIIRNRRAIRKYLSKKVEREKLEKIVEAGLFAPSSGGDQSSKIILIDNAELIDRIGIVNANCENRSWGRGVSTDQPSIIDDLSIRSGFYSCPALGVICIQRKFYTYVNAIGTAFISAQNMCLEAYDLGVSSVIVGRAEATFQQPEMQELLSRWGLDPEYMPIAFVCLGYINGDYPSVKARKENRAIFVD